MDMFGKIVPEGAPDAEVPVMIKPKFGYNAEKAEASLYYVDREHEVSFSLVNVHVTEDGNQSIFAGTDRVTGFPVTFTVVANAGVPEVTKVTVKDQVMYPKKE